jgi:subtilase family serine protease
MRSIKLGGLALAAVCASGLFLSAPSFPQTPVRNRIVQEIDRSAMTPLRGSVNPRIRGRVDQGQVDDWFPMQHLRMIFQLSASQQADLGSLLREQQDPKSPNYHRWLTPEEYGSRFGLSSADLSKVVAWLEEQGFTVEGTARAQNWVEFSGTAAQVESVFDTSIHQYAKNGVLRYANAVDPSVPAALSGVVLEISGLNNFRLKPQVKVRVVRPGAQSKFTSGVSGDHFLAPADFATIYNVQGLYNAGITGSGEKIAVLGQTDIVMKDISEFRANSGLPVNNPAIVKTPEYVSITSSGDLTEADLDLEWSGAVARDASIIYVNSGNSSNGVFDSLTYAVDNNLAPVVSTSYGYCEAGFGGASAINSVQSQLQQANAQGITVLAPAGDDGATDCDNNSSTPSDLAVKGLAVDFPGSSPNATSVGGTEFYNDAGSGGSIYWSASNNSSTQGSALSYIPEMVWNDTAQDGQLAGGGGGASTVFSKPVWQTGAGVPADGARDVPDVALTASADHDGYLVCSSDYLQTDPSATADCVNGFRASDQTIDIVGGTSAPTPAFAGIVALIDQKTGKAQGNINPVLYPLAAKSTDAFHDVTKGNNKQPCKAGTANCPSGGQIGYSAAAGYDQASGLGSVDADNLVTEWASGSSRGGPTPNYQLAPAPAALSLAAGGSATSTITLSPSGSFAGTVNFTCSVGSGLSGVSCSVSPASVTAGGSTTLTVTASKGAGVYALPSSGRYLPLTLLVLAFGAGALLLSARRRPEAALAYGRFRAPRRFWLGLAVAGLLAAGASCGGGSSSSPSAPSAPTAQVESGNVTVTGTSGSLTHTSQVTVQVN